LNFRPIVQGIADYLSGALDKYPDHSIMSEPSFLSNSSEEVGAGHCSSDAASAAATGRVSAAIATAAARQAANVKSRTMALVRMPAV
jgi:hypothetical protein